MLGLRLLTLARLGAISRRRWLNLLALSHLLLLEKVLGLHARNFDGLRYGLSVLSLQRFIQGQVLRASAVSFLRLVAFVNSLRRRGEVKLLLLGVNLIVLDNRANDLAHVVLVGHFLKNRGDSGQLGVSWVVVPTNSWNSVFWLEQVCDR